MSTPVTTILDAFHATYADDPSTPVSLTQVKLGNRSVILHGNALTPTGSQAGGVIQTGPISDWVIEYGAAPGVWAISADKWYKLLRPASNYAALHYEVQRKLDLCARAAHILRQRPDLRLDVVHQLILQPSAGPMGSLAAYTVQELQVEAPFMLGQLAMLAKRLNIQSAGDLLPPLLADLAKMSTADSVAEVLLSLALDDDDGEVDDDSDDDEDGPSAKRQRTSDPRTMQEMLADSQRGPPPTPCTDWRVEPHMLSDLLMVWEMCMAFSHLLQLPPISLHALEAAIMPGPIPLRTAAHPAVPAPVRERSVSEDAAQQERDFVGPGKIPQKPYNTPRNRYNLHTLLDPDATASGIILRDIHAALIKVYEGFSTKRLHDPPEVGKLAPDDNKAELWQERVVGVLLDPKTPQEQLQPGAKAAAEILRAREYPALTPVQRLSILRSLADLALNSEVMREYVLQKAELVGNTAKPKGGFLLLAADPDEDAEEAGVRGYSTPALSAAELQDPNTWMRWLEGCRCVRHGALAELRDPNTWKRWIKGSRFGVRRPLGVDLRGRRYWAFGNRAGCWRIFVEGTEGGSWGWYEGATIPALLQWLKAADATKELPLRKALEAMPLPKKFTAEPLPAQPLPLPAAPEGEAEPTILWTAEDLKNRRPDGYKLLAAPMLKGEYHQHVPSGLRPITVQERLLSICEALLTEFDFYLQPSQQLANMMGMLASIKAGPAAEQAKVVTQLEAVLHEANMTSAAWREELRDIWLKSLAREGLTTKDVTMHVAALQYHILERPHRLTRLTFIRQTQSLRCPLMFPAKDDIVVLMRTGCMMHLDKYANMAQHYNVDDVIMARNNVARLRPVEQCKVVAIGYRSYPITSVEVLSTMAAGGGMPVKQEGGGGPTGGGHASHGLAPGQKAAAGVVNPNRPPCMWMVLQQVLPDGQPGPTEQQGHLISVPIHIDAALPDYIVRPDLYQKGMLKTWRAGERFRMYFGGKVGSKTGGMWYKGTIKDFVQAQGHKGDPNYDPWDSIIVKWDLDDGSSQTMVNPWEIEIDPDEAKQREAERRKAEEAAARAQRAEAKGRRSAARIRAIMDNELDTDPESSESISDDDEEDEDSGGGRRRYNKRKPQGRDTHNQQPRMNPAQQAAHFQQLSAQHHQHHATLLQQLQHLQSVGQGTSPIAQSVLQALQQVQRAQQQLLLSAGVHQQQQAQQGQRPGPQNQHQPHVHPHQQQLLQQQAGRQQPQQPQQQQSSVHQQQLLQQQMLLQQQQAQQQQQAAQQQQQHPHMIRMQQQQQMMTIQQQQQQAQQQQQPIMGQQMTQQQQQQMLMQQQLLRQQQQQQLLQQQQQQQQRGAYQGQYQR